MNPFEKDWRKLNALPVPTADVPVRVPIVHSSAKAYHEARTLFLETRQRMRDLAEELARLEKRSNELRQQCNELRNKAFQEFLEATGIDDTEE